LDLKVLRNYSIRFTYFYIISLLLWNSIDLFYDANLFCYTVEFLHHFTKLPIQPAEIDPYDKLFCRINNLKHYADSYEYTVNTLLIIPLLFALKGYSFFHRLKIVLIIAFICYIFQLLISANDVYSGIYSHYHNLATEKHINVEMIFPFDSYRERLHYWIRYYYMVCFRHVILFLTIIGTLLIPRNSIKNGNIAFIALSCIIFFIWFSNYQKIMDSQLSIKADNYLQNGISEYKKGNYKKALHLLQLAETEHPSNGIIHFNLGRVYYSLGNYDESISSYSLAIKSRPRAETLYNHRGMAYKYVGKIDQALDDYNQAIELNSRYYEAFNNRGVVYKKLGMIDEAIAEYSQALKIQPNFLIALKNRSIAYQVKNQFINAIVDLNHTISIDPKDTFALLSRGMIYMTQFKEKTKACADWKRSCKLGQCRNYSFAKKKGLCH